MAVHKFVISDETLLNDYGFRVMTNGIELAQYKKNPIVLWFHKRPSRWDPNDRDSLPIGTASNLRKENAQLIADVEFDEDDEFATKIEKKVAKGIIRMASPGLRAIEWSKDKRVLLPGQVRETLKKSELIEISIVDIGSNRNALRLYDAETNMVNLAAGGENVVPKLEEISKQKKESKMSDFIKTVAERLKLNSSSAEDVVLAELDKQLGLANKAAGLEQEVKTLKSEQEKIELAGITSLVDQQVDRKITADKKDKYIQLGQKLGADELKDIFDDMPAISGKPTDELNLGSSHQQQETGEVKSFADLKKKGMAAVELYKKENPKEYVKLFKDEYGFEPEMSE